MINLEELLPRVEQWSREVGNIQLKNLGNKELDIDIKGSYTDIVTEVDKLSEKHLIKVISDTYPYHGILSEESGHNTKESDYLWIIDPLDGTTNYSKGIPIFAVSIALKYKEETVLGLIYNPYQEEMFTAVKEGGAFLNGEKIQVTDKEDLQESLLATGFPYDKNVNPDNNFHYFAHFLTRARGIRRMGAAAWDLSYVAAGRFDGFWELNLAPWDVAAGALLVEEAGGKVVYLDKRGVSLAAANHLLCDKMLEEMKTADIQGHHD